MSNLLVLAEMFEANYSFQSVFIQKYQYFDETKPECLTYVVLEQDKVSAETKGNLRI